MKNIFLIIIGLLILASPCLGDEQLNFGLILKKDLPMYLRNFDATTNHSNRLQDLVKFNDDSDSYLYRFLYEALKRKKFLTNEELSSRRLNSLNQGSVGSCVGYGHTICLDILAAVDYINKPHLRQEFKVRFNPDAMYAIGRADNLGGWDGSQGSWQIAGMNKYGTLNRLIYDSIDLINTTPQDGRKWARNGLPRELFPHAEEHRVISCELVTSLSEAKAALQNGYPVSICSNEGFESTRSSAGVSRRSGNWAHCMAVIAYRNNELGEHFLIQNSWGNNWNGGGVQPNDMPHGSFWVSPQDLQVILNYKESYAIAGLIGFEKRALSWDEVFGGRENEE